MWPTQINSSESNRRTLDLERAHEKRLHSIKYAGYTTLKPPGVKKTMATRAQEPESPEPPAPLQVLPDASGLSSWQTDSFPNSSFMPMPPPAPSALSRSPVLNFRDFDDTRSIYIHQDSSLV